MIKQILNRLPRKTHKSHDRRDGVNPNSSSNSPKTNNDVRSSTSNTSKTKNDVRSSSSNTSSNSKTKNDAVNITRSSSSNVPPTGINQPNNKPLPQSQASQSSTVSSIYDTLPSFNDVPNSEKQNLFIQKLTLCGVVYDLTDPTKNVKEKEIKKLALIELVDYIITVNGKFPETVIQEIVKMVSGNIFRRLTPQPRANKVLETFDGEEEEPCMDPQWPHLHLVYEFTLRFVASPETDPKVAKRYIDCTFVSKFLDLFDSEDIREREYLKFILHRMYGKFMVHRPFIRKAINNILFRFVFETEKHNGIAELLEILGSIINGFALPLKEEHKLFLVRALIPLHKPKCLPMYHPQLTYCITQFVEKDCKLADTIIRGLLKYWPITNSSKEVMFLSELEEVLEATQPPEFQRCMVPLFRQIARCLSSPHFQVAERALFLWNNDHIESLIKQNRKVLLPIIFPALERNTMSHWNKAVQSLTLNVRKIFSDADPQNYEECSKKFKEGESKREESTSKLEATWKRLEEVAAQRAGGGHEPMVMSQKVIANHVQSPG